MNGPGRLLGLGRALRTGPPEPSLQRASKRQRRLIVDTILLGVVGALGAQLFMLMLRVATDLLLTDLARYQAPGLPSEGGTLGQSIGPYGLWLIPVATTLGGLIVGWMVHRWAPEAEGHGTDTVIRAYHQSGGEIRGRVAPVKMIASAITIGSGGAAGREGPVALIAAGVASWYADLRKYDADDRRLLLLVGMASGLSAIFRSPIGTAIMAIEVLYSDMEFEPGALLYTMIGSIVAYGVNGLFVGWQPLFQLPGPVARLERPEDYVWYVVIGLAAGVVGTILPAVFYGIRDWFRHMRIQPFLKPALGGLFTGLIALVYPQILGGGYGWMQRAIDGQLMLGTLAVLAFAKIVALSLSVGSGESGGVFAPSLYVGAMLGGFVAAVTHQPTVAFVVVGMAAVFAGAAHLPIATLMMVCEMTGGYTLLVPAALAVMISFLVQNRLSLPLKYRSIYEAQVSNRAESPAHRARQLQVALRLLRRERIPDLSDVGELDLLSLLKSGIPVDVPGDRQLVAGALRARSPFVGTTVGRSGRRLVDGGTNIIAIVRGDRVIVPEADTVLEAEDRLILVVAARDVERVRAHLDRW